MHLLTGSGNLELKEKDIITFELKNTKGSVLRGMSAYSGFIRASLSETDEVPYGGSYPIGINLPEIKVTDFIKFLSVVTGTFPRQLNGDSIEMVEIQQVFNHWQPREDWTRKLIPYEWSNSPRNVEYTIEDYYRHNWYKWKEDDTVNGSYDADIKVDNETLEYFNGRWEALKLESAACGDIYVISAVIVVVLLGGAVFYVLLRRYRRRFY